MAKYKYVSIKHVFYEINKNYLWHEIQMEYVWLKKAEERKIEQFFDSVLRGYPIGSFLFWKLKKEDFETNKENRELIEKLNFQQYKFLAKNDGREVHNIKINAEEVNSNDHPFVLNGQQLLTSLYIGFINSRTLSHQKGSLNNSNAYEEKKLFLNLKHKPKFKNPEDRFDFKFLKYKETTNTDDKFWFKVADILEMDSVISYVRNHNLSKIETENLEKLKEVFCIQKPISYFEDVKIN